MLTNSNDGDLPARYGRQYGGGLAGRDVQFAPLADLVAGTLTIPANAIVGQNITLSYQVSNDSSRPANGTWSDALYLSTTDAWTAASVGCWAGSRRPRTWPPAAAVIPARSPPAARHHPGLGIT